MTQKEFLNRLKVKGIEPEHLNTNNDWGFGGAIKDVYKLTDTLTIHKGKACYRHRGQAPFINLRENGIIRAEGMKEIEKVLIKFSQWEKLVN